MLSDFLYRVADYFHRNRARLIKWLLIAAAALLAVSLIHYGVEKWQRAKYEKRVNALERQFQKADAEAKAAEAKAHALADEIAVKETELRDLEARAASAEKAVRKTRTVYIPLKETYEKARNNPVVAADTTCADACAELARLGYECK